MYIRKQSVAAFYKLLIGVLALSAWWFLLVQNGWSAFRLYPTWALGITAIYFIAAAAILALRQGDKSDSAFCPMLEGMILMGFILMSGMAVASAVDGFDLPEIPTWVIVLVVAVLPVLVLLDWLLFCKKGRWQAIDPFYWLALPVTYCATMIFTAEILPEDLVMWRYPVPFLNYMDFGLFEMLGWMLVVAILQLAVSYVLFLVDFAMSGKLAKRIVLPHIRTVMVEESDTSQTGHRMEKTAVKSIQSKSITVQNSASQSKQQLKTPKPARKPSITKPKKPEATSKAKESDLSQARNARESLEIPTTRLKVNKTKVDPKISAEKLQASKTKKKV